MNTGCGERGRSGRGGAGRGRPQSTAPGATQTKASSRTQDPERAWPQRPLPRPRGGPGGRTAAEPLTLAPCPLPRPASPPLLGPGSEKVLGWADSGVNSIEFSFGYTLKAKVSWTYSQNG